MTDFQFKLLSFLANGPAHAEEIGKHLWPDRTFRSPAKGGPWGGAVAASYQCGRIANRTGWVQTAYEHSHWCISHEGRKMLEFERLRREEVPKAGLEPAHP